MTRQTLQKYIEFAYVLNIHDIRVALFTALPSLLVGRRYYLLFS